MLKRLTSLIQEIADRVSGNRAARRFVAENPETCRRTLKWYSKSGAAQFLSLVAQGTGYGYIPPRAMRKTLEQD